VSLKTSTGSGKELMTAALIHDSIYVARLATIDNYTI
jgi:hypothetical protein